jgi:hypothetical protein
MDEVQTPVILSVKHLYQKASESSLLPLGTVPSSCACVFVCSAGTLAVATRVSGHV